MLTKLLAKLNGSGSDPAALSEVLAGLGRDRQAAQAEITALRERRHQALLEDASDQVLEGIERKIERAETSIEKIDLALPGVRERLAAAQAKARKDAEPGFIDQYRVAFDDYFTALRAIVDAHRRSVEIRERAGAVLGDARADVLLPPFAYAGALTHEFLSDWLERNDSALRVSAGTEPPERRPATPGPARSRDAPPQRLPHERVPSIDLPRTVSLDFTTNPPQGPRPPRLADDLTPLKPGNVHVTITHEVEYEGQQLPAGWKGQLPRDAALARARSGALDIPAEEL